MKKYTEMTKDELMQEKTALEAEMARWLLYGGKSETLSAYPFELYRTPDGRV